MMTKKILIAFCVFTCFLVNSCKRYEEDDRRYFKTPCGRVAKKWQLYKITDQNGVDYADSLIYYGTWNSSTGTWQPAGSFVYRGLILELERSNNKLCLETGIRGNARVLNKPYSSGHYELIDGRSRFRFDIRPDENTPTRYFLDTYSIYKMTSDELIFGNYLARAYFKVAN